jgi:predicted RNA-binding protein with PIN domain
VTAEPAPLSGPPADPPPGTRPAPAAAPGERAHSDTGAPGEPAASAADEPASPRGIDGEAPSARGLDGEPAPSAAGEPASPRGIDGEAPSARGIDGEPAPSAAGEPASLRGISGEEGPSGGGDGAGAGGGVEPVLPEAVRARVLALAAAALGRLPADQVPPTLRAAARFTPSKRVRLAGPALAAALSADAVFRLRAAEQAERESPDVVEAARDGILPGAADPVELAAAAYLLRPPSWTELLERSRTVLEERASRSRDRTRAAEVEQLRAELAEAHAGQRDQAQRARAAAEAARAEADTLRRQLREQTGARRAAERARTAAEEALAEERRRAAIAESGIQAEIRRLRQRLAEAEDAVEAGRRAARETRQADAARLWLLLDTLTGAAQGLRRELALTPTEERPADSVAASQPRPDAPAARGDDPELVDRLLELPRVHLVVDGYNVTKSGYGELPLAVQRSRLIQGLGALVARTGAEVTVVFDGATRPPAMPPAPRGVRVLFSAPGEIADDLIRRLVAAEPEGRPLMVVSSDKEVATDVSRAGAYAVPSALLLRRLDRG